MSTNHSARHTRVVSLFVSYGLAVLLVAAATAIRWGLGYGFGPIAPFLTFYPALMLASLFGGLGPGLVATGLGVLAADYFFFPPYGSFRIAALGDAVSLSLFCFIGIFISIITHRLRKIQAERIEWRSEQRWATTLSSIGDAVIATDVAGRITFMNPVAERLTGWPFSDASMTSVAEVFNIVNEHTRQRVESPVTKVLRQGTVVGLANHTILVKKDGSEIPIDDSGAPVKDTDGTTTGVVLVFRDISERKKAEEQIAKERYLQQLLLDHFPGVALLLRTTTREVVASNQAGRDVGAVPGATCFDTWGQNQDPCPWCLAEDLWATGKEQHVVLDGGDKVMEAHWVPVADDLYMHYAFDITERARAAERLREKDRVIQQALSISNSFTFDWDVTNDIVVRSDSCKTIFGADCNELFDATSELYARYVHPEDRVRFEKLLRNLTPAADTYTMDYRLVLSEGRELTFEETARASFDRAGKAVRVIGVATDVTKRKAAEAALRKSEERYRTTLTSIGDAVITTDGEGRITYLNKVAEALTGWTLDEANGLPLARVFEIINEFTRRPAENPVGRVLREGYVVGLANHTTLVSRDGREIPIEDSAAPIGGDGKITGVVMVFHDVTEKRKAENALRESEERFRTMADAVPQLAWIAKDDGYIFWYNRRWYDYTGTTPKDMEGWGWQSVHDPAVLPRVLEQWKASIATGVPFDMVFPLRGADDQFRPFLTRVMPLKDASGKVVQWFGTNTDITEQKKIEEELEQRVVERTAEVEKERRRLYDVLETVPIMICLLTPDYHVAFANRSFRDKFGEAKGRHCYDYCFGKSQPCDFCESYKVLETGQPHHWEVTTPDGAAVIDAWDFPFTDVDGSPLILEMDIDITEQRQAEETRRQLEVQLRQAQKMEALGVMSGGIAHDFNNILAAIIGFTELIEGHLSQDSKDKRHARRVMEASMRGRELVKQMLSFSRKGEEEKKPLQLSSIVKEAVKLLRATIPSTISIRSTITSESGLVLADPTQIHQVVMNLCTNAAFAMREKGGTLDIELADFSVSPGRDMKPGLYMRLTVSDTGAGIPPEDIDKVFDPFFTTKKVGEGTGLGLSVVHGIVKGSGGFITVESALGKGSTFTVYLPKVAEDAQAEAPSQAEIPTGTERILFIDDEEALVEMGEDVLAELGYQVTSLMSSVEALSALKKDPQRFDLVITDQTMPEMTGIELARQILSTRPDMPIIMATGFSHLVDADKAKAAGIRAFVMKPLTRGEIARTIRKVLAG